MSICTQRYIKVDHFLCLQISIDNYHSIFEILVLKEKQILLMVESAPP